MSNSWKEYKLGELATLRKENVTPVNFNNEKYIGLEHIGQGNFLLESIGIASDVTSNKSRFIDGDILYGKIRPYFKKVYRPSFAGICSTDILVIIAKNENIVTQEYLYQITKTQSFTDKATETSSGTKMPRADWDSLCNINIELPPLPEQQAIAEILSSLDDKIELNLQTNKTLEEMANALYKHWFVDFGPFKDGNFIESELGLIPEGWQAKPYYQIAKYINGTSIKQNQFSEPNKGRPIVKIAELKQGITAQTGYSEYQFDDKYIFKSSDLLFSWSGNPHTSIDIFIWDKMDAILNQHIFKVVPELSLEKPFIYFTIKYYLNTFITLATRKQTTGLGHFTNEDLKTNHVIVPSPLAHKEYNKIASNYFEMIYNNQIENQTLKQTRDYLLPKLISGEIRVKDVAKKVKELL